MTNSASIDRAGQAVTGVLTAEARELIDGQYADRPPGDGTLRLFRGAKLRFADVDPGLVEQAMRPGRRLIARVRLTDARGNPVCARLRPPAITWSAGPG